MYLAGVEDAGGQGINEVLLRAEAPDVIKRALHGAINIPRPRRSTALTPLYS